MSMIRKIIPVSLYDIPGLEGWLEEQASQGLFPTSLGSWAVFEDRGLPGTRFRLDPFANRTGEGLEPTEEKLELYRQAGWEYAFRVGRAYFLFYTTDPQAPELFSDHQSQGLSLNRLVKDLRSYRRRKIVLWSLLGVLFLAVLFLGYSYDVQPDHFVRLPLILLQLFNPVLLFFLTGLCFYSPPWGSGEKVDGFRPGWRASRSWLTSYHTGARREQDRRATFSLFSPELFRYMVS